MEVKLIDVAGKKTACINFFDCNQNFNRDYFVC